MTRAATRLVIGLVAALAFGAPPLPPATAQDSAVQRGAERSAECGPSGSRARPSCDPETTTTVQTQSEITFSLKLPKLEPVQCAASIAIEYSQANTVLNVDGTVENHDCAASSGEYRVIVSVRDAQLDVKRLEFLESWERQDDRPVKFTSAYPIGENVEVTRVRSVALRCTCADAAKQE